MEYSEETYKVNDLVWYEAPSSTSDKNDELYVICSVVKIKNEKEVVLSLYNNTDENQLFTGELNKLHKANNAFSLYQNDIIQLKHINEPSVLYHLQERFMKKEFYTKMGPLLIFVNPHTNINIKDDKTLENYHCSNLNTKLNLCELQVVNNALRNFKMLKQTQSIIITGVSRSGKSEITNNILNYLFTMKKKFIKKNKNIDNNTYHYNTIPATSQTINETNEISNVFINFKHAHVLLESFGNVFTSKNQNSSVFSRIWSIYLDDCLKVNSFQVYNILLDKKYLINRDASMESCFKIFYYMIKGSSENFKRMYHLDKIVNYNMLNNEQINNEILFKKYSENFFYILQSLNYMINNDEELYLIFSLLSAMLHLGNVDCEEILKSKKYIFKDGYLNYMFRNNSEFRNDLQRIDSEMEKCDNDSELFDNFTRFDTFKQGDKSKQGDANFGKFDSYTELDNSIKHILIVSKLLNIDASVLLKYFLGNNHRFTNILHWKTHSDGSKIQKKIDSFIKICYDELFNWILNKINRKCQNGINMGKKESSINVLDVMSFADSNTDNTLNELLINTSMECVLMMYYNFIYNKNLPFYKMEEIDIMYDTQSFDNIDLFNVLVQNEEMNLLSYLGKVCEEKMGKDMNNIVSTIVHEFGSSRSNHNLNCGRYIKEGKDINYRNKKFVISHSFGDVLYNSKNFINVDMNSQKSSIINILKTSDNIYFRKLFDKTNDYIIKEFNKKKKSSTSCSVKLGKSKRDDIVPKHNEIVKLRNNLLVLKKLQENTFCHFILCIKPNENKTDFLKFDKKLVQKQLKIFQILKMVQLKCKYFPYEFTLSEFLKIFRLSKANESNRKIRPKYDSVCTSINETLKKYFEGTEGGNNDNILEEVKTIEELYSRVSKLIYKTDDTKIGNIPEHVLVQIVLQSHKIGNEYWSMGKNMIFLSEYAFSVLSNYMLYGCEDNNNLDELDEEERSNEMGELDEQVDLDAMEKQDKFGESGEVDELINLKNQSSSFTDAELSKPSASNNFNSNNANENMNTDMYSQLSTKSFGLKQTFSYNKNEKNEQNDKNDQSGKNDQSEHNNMMSSSIDISYLKNIYKTSDSVMDVNNNNVGNDIKENNVNTLENDKNRKELTDFAKEDLKNVEETKFMENKEEIEYGYTLKQMQLINDSLKRDSVYNKGFGTSCYEVINNQYDSKQQQEYEKIMLGLHLVHDAEVEKKEKIKEEKIKEEKIKEEKIKEEEVKEEEVKEEEVKEEKVKEEEVKEEEVKEKEVKEEKVKEEKVKEEKVKEEKVKEEEVKEEKVKEEKVKEKEVKEEKVKEEKVKEEKVKEKEVKEEKVKEEKVKEEKVKEKEVKEEKVKEKEEELDVSGVAELFGVPRESVSFALTNLFCDEIDEDIKENVTDENVGLSVKNLVKEVSVELLP
ncbi:myosin E, putative, partial [Hepatocystis sp. ex Piliocolobus tephrosceles]